MQQRTQPVVHATEQAEETPLPPKPRSWPVLVWGAVLAVAFVVGAQVTSLGQPQRMPGFLPVHHARVEPVVTVAPPIVLPEPVKVPRGRMPPHQLHSRSQEDLVIASRLLGQRELAGAQVRAEACVAADPTDPRCHSLLGIILGERHETERSAQELREFLRLQMLEENPELSGK